MDGVNRIPARPATDEEVHRFVEYWSAREGVVIDEYPEVAYDDEDGDGRSEVWIRAWVRMPSE